MGSSNSKPRDKSPVGSKKKKKPALGEVYSTHSGVHSWAWKYVASRRSRSVSILRPSESVHWLHTNPLQGYQRHFCMGGWGTQEREGENDLIVVESLAGYPRLDLFQRILID